VIEEGRSTRQLPQYWKKEAVMSLSKFALIATLGVSLAACETTGQKQGAGTVIGAVGGAIAGAQFGKGDGKLAATAVGTLLGAIVGSEIGKSLDHADQLALAQTTQQTLEVAPSGHTNSWRNPDSGNSGTITPTQAYTKNDGQPCREFQQTVTIGGDIEEAYGTACRQADGTWKIGNR
jgi:surface antigen